MRKIIFIAALLLLPSSAYAETSVVNVKNSVNTQGSSSTHTEIKIESNGETKTYTSDEPGEVNIESSDGNASVKVKTSTNTTTKPTVSHSPTPTTAEKIKKEIKKVNKSILENIKLNFFERLFYLFHF